ncbi:MAG: ATP-binding protein, partial [Proteobacteria bacterium]|nr:ATP-binding protein [Pseudomonadota bacterium]
MIRQPLHPGVQRGCPNCDEDGYVVIRDGEKAMAQICQCVGHCPRCKDTHFVTSEQGNRFAPRRRCECTTLANRIRIFNEANIPARHANSTRANFRRSKLLGPPFSAVSAFIQGFSPKEDNRGIILWGKVGTGKTHLIVATLRDLIFQHGVTARFVEFSHLLAELKSGFDRGQGASSLIDPLVRVEVLAIDELGKGRNTEFEGTVLDELVSRRYNASATIIGTTNYAPLPPAGSPVPNHAKPSQTTNLGDRVGPRVYS